MDDPRNRFAPSYDQSHALVIGINAYASAPPLRHARSDAEGIADALEAHGFPKANVTRLLDEDATRDAVLRAYHGLAATGENDRVVVAFAGHGITVPGRKREAWYLVPADGNPGILSTLISWADLVGGSDLITAKHMLFIMDACYSGLIFNRAIPPGSHRFLEDLLQRFSRQAIAAGKGNQPVADGGGPQKGHSVFTGHLLDALQGAAAAPDGIMTAQSVMSYVYQQVPRDPESEQTPNYGHLEGEGDLVFTGIPVAADPEEGTTTTVVEPAFTPDMAQDLGELSRLAAQTKEYLSDARFAIRLDDLVVDELRKFYQRVDESHFPLQGTFSVEDLLARLLRYESAVERLQVIATLLGRWASPASATILEKLITRAPDMNAAAVRGNVVAIRLRWYPIMILLYSAGIGALAAGRFDNLGKVLNAPAAKGVALRDQSTVHVHTVEEMLEVDRAELFKSLPGHERHYVPRSEYLFRILQRTIEDLVFPGAEYEDLFDKLEIYYALVYAWNRERGDRPWGPFGRFAYKHRNMRTGNDPLEELVGAAEADPGNWPPAKAGLFGGPDPAGGQSAQVTRMAREFADRVAKVGWF